MYIYIYVYITLPLPLSRLPARSEAGQVPTSAKRLRRSRLLAWGRELRSLLPSGQTEPEQRPRGERERGREGERVKEGRKEGRRETGKEKQSVGLPKEWHPPTPRSSFLSNFKSAGALYGATGGTWLEHRQPKRPAELCSAGADAFAALEASVARVQHTAGCTAKLLSFWFTKKEGHVTHCTFTPGTMHVRVMMLAAALSQISYGATCYLP